jgi:GDP-L-fucose synthase
MLHNLLVQTHVIHHAYLNGVKKLFFLASSCSYPRNCPQPMEESSLLTGALEPTNEAYALAKLAGIKLCQAYRQQYGVNFVTGIPANIFGPGDEFSPENSHVIEGLMRRMHEAKIQGAPSISVWGTGTPRRDFIFVDDLADACILVMQAYNDPQPINLGIGEGLTIGELAGLIRDVLGFTGEILFDPSKPDGMPVKVLDSRKLQALGWRPGFTFRAALEATYNWFCRQ